MPLHSTEINPHPKNIAKRRDQKTLVLDDRAVNNKVKQSWLQAVHSIGPLSEGSHC